jgi:cell division topological specificity factor
MLENFKNLFKKFGKSEDEENNSGDAAKERLHLVLMQDRANVSADFLDMMKQEIIDVIKKYIDVDEDEMDVRLTNQIKDDGTNGAPALYANIPIIKIKNEKINMDNQKNNENNINKADKSVKK